MTANWIKLNDDTELQLFHTLFTGQTNLSGKTTAIRTLTPRAVKEGFTVLVFDTKPTVREFEGYHDIPLCYRPTTDPLVLIGLLEGIFKHRLSILYSTLGRIAQGAEDIPDIIRNAEKMEHTAKSGFIKDACFQLADLLGRLQRELQGLDLSSDLELNQGEINVMPLNGLSIEAQQLVIKTAFELAIKRHNKRVILVIDEAFRFLPQAYSSACKKPVQDVITQGAKTGLFVWLATQFIATTEKDAIKGMANKLLGRQDDPTEIKATIERTRESHPKLKPDDLMTLKRGEFIFVPIDGPVKKIYVPISEDMKRAEAPKKARDITPPRPPKAQSAKPTLDEAISSAISKALDKPSEIDIEEKAIVIKLSKSEKVIHLDTDSQRGQVIFILSQGADLTLSTGQVLRETAEHGWVIPESTAINSLFPSMVRDGLLIKEGGEGKGNPARYRLPHFVRFDVKEIPA